MKQAIPMRQGLVPSRLPTPQVTTLVAKEPVDLKPAGNTVAVTTTAQNPFTQAAVVSVHTQASGGMAPAPATMQSKGLTTRFLPGIGQDPNANNQGAPATEQTRPWYEGLLKATEDVTGVLTEQQRAEAEAARAQAEASRAEAAGDMARAAEARARADALLAAAAGGARTAQPILLWGGLALLGVAGFMMFRSQKKGYGMTGRRAPKRRRTTAKRRTTKRRR